MTGLLDCVQVGYRIICPWRHLTEGAKKMFGRFARVSVIALAGLAATQLIPSSAMAQYNDDEGYGQPRWSHRQDQNWDRPRDWDQGGCSRRDLVDAARAEGFPTHQFYSDERTTHCRARVRMTAAPDACPLPTDAVARLSTSAQVTLIAISRLRATSRAAGSIYLKTMSSRVNWEQFVAGVHKEFQCATFTSLQPSSPFWC